MGFWSSIAVKLFTLIRRTAKSRSTPHSAASWAVVDFKGGKARAQAGPTRRLYVTPPELMTSISPPDRDSAIALVNFQPQALSKDRVRFDLRVAFQCIPVRKERLLSYADFYIGCTSA